MNGGISADDVAAAPTTSPGAAAVSEDAPLPDGTDGATPGPRPGGLRWGLILAGVAVVIGSLAGLAALLTLPPRDETLAYVPADSVYVLGLRPDLPSGQRAALGTLIARFPVGDEVAGASDPVNALLDRLVGSATDGSRTYTNDLAAYAAGPMVLAAIPGAVPEPAGSAAGEPLPPDVVAVLTTDGSVACEDLQAGQSVSTEDHGGVRILILTSDQTSADEGVMACAMQDRILLAGTPTAVRAALDARETSRGIAGDSTFSTARAQLDAEPAAWFFARTAALAEMAASVPWPSDVPEELRGGISAVQPMAAWAAGQVRFESAGVVLETVTPETATETGSSGSPDPGAAGSGTLAHRLPPSTVLLMDLSAADSLLPDPGAAASPGAGGTPLPGFPGGESLLPFLAGAGDLSGLPGRAALIVTAAPDRSGAALVMELPSSSDGASIAQLLALLAFSGGSQDTYKGTTILTVPLADLAGAADPSGIEPPSLPVGDDSRLAMAVHGDLLVVGLGDAVVKAVIDTSDGATLADQDAYRTAMDAAGSSGLPEVFVDVRGLLPLAEAAAREGDPAMADRAGEWIESVSTIASRLARVDGYIRSRTIITIE